MPWELRSVLEMRSELVSLAGEGVSVASLARRFGVSRQCAHKWIRRHGGSGTLGLLDQSRKPLKSPTKSEASVENAVIEIRREHPAWGGRKIRRRLQDLGKPAPSASTITQILRRAGLLEESDRPQRDWVRFERELPNELWQMDFKGHFATLTGRCHPFTLLDDHSRYLLGLEARSNQQLLGVKEALTGAFQIYGMPLAILCDNGPPFNSPFGPTALWTWLTRLGIELHHGRPLHPQTQGKLERLHRTLAAELLAGRSFKDLESCQSAFSLWRQSYNAERPHESLDLETPVKRYKPSPREFPKGLPPIEYEASDFVRKVSQNGFACFKGREFRMPKALAGQPIAFRPTSKDGVWEARFCATLIAQIDLRVPSESVNYVSEHV